MTHQDKKRIIDKAGFLPAATLNELALNISIVAKELDITLTVAEVVDLAEEVNHDLPDDGVRV